MLDIQMIVPTGRPMGDERGIRELPFLESFLSEVEKMLKSLLEMAMGNYKIEIWKTRYIILKKKLL